MDNGAAEAGQESGGSLREKLEAALATNATLATQVASYQAKDLISAKGYKHVTAEELQGVKLDEIEAKAAEIEQTKVAQREAVLREVLGDKVDKADLDAMVKSLVGDQGNDGAEALDRIRAIGKQAAVPVSKPEDATLFGPSKIRAAFA
jgi:hypothetical protein